MKAFTMFQIYSTNWFHFEVRFSLQEVFMKSSKLLRLDSSLVKI